MAGFCSKCGAPLAANAAFCAACGTAAGNVTAAQVTPPPILPPASGTTPPGYSPVDAPGIPAAGYPPAAAYPAMPPSKGPSQTLKIVLIVLAVVVGLGVLLAGLGGYFAWKVSKGLNANGNSVSFGNSADITEADLGVPMYPGSVRKETGGMKIKGGSSLVVSQTYTTSDPPSAVLDFYRGKLAATGADSSGRRSAVTETTGGRSTTTLTSSNIDGDVKDSLVITVTPNSDSGQTQIMILHTRKGESGG